MKLTALQLADMVKGEVVGNPSVIVSTYSKIEEAEQGSLTFLANPKYTHYIYETRASVVLVRRDFKPEHEIQATLIKVDDPYDTLAFLLSLVSKTMPEKKGVEQPVFVSEGVEVPEDAYIGAFAYIGKNVRLGSGVKIYPQCYVGDNVTIGDGTCLYPGVKIYQDCVIGNHCILHSGVVVGSDGFGFAPHNGGYDKIAQIGNVIIEDNVEIGANTVVDRATMGSTFIRKGVKLDNLIQIAHNVEIGENTVIAAQTGVAGSTKIGKHNMIGGQVGFAGHLHIGDNNQFGAQSGVQSNIASGKVFMGYPAVEGRGFMKQTAYLRKLGDFYAEFNQLKKEVDNIKNNNKE